MKTRFLLSVVFRFYKREYTMAYTAFYDNIAQDGVCHRSGVIEVDENNLDELSRLVGDKLDSMLEEVNNSLGAKRFRDVNVGAGTRKLPDTTYLPCSHSLVRI